MLTVYNAPKGHPEPDTNPNRRLQDLAALFLKLGALAFGGPAAHIAMMEDEVVVRKKWMTRPQLLDLLGATNLIPGPNSTELAIHIGFARAGWRGLIVSGACFILPAMVIVWALAMLYVHYQSLSQIEWMLYGIKPVMVAIIIQALWRLGQTAVKDWLTGMAGAGATPCLWPGSRPFCSLSSRVSPCWWRRTGAVGALDRVRPVSC